MREKRENDLDDDDGNKKERKKEWGQWEFMFSCSWVVEEWIGKGVRDPNFNLGG